MFKTLPKSHYCMVEDIVAIAEKKGLVNSVFGETLVIDTLEGKHCKGGRQIVNGKLVPWIGINKKYRNNPNRWKTVNDPWVAKWKEHLARFHILRGNKAQMAKTIKQLESGKVAWTEYNRISNDPEIGDWFGDPEIHMGAPLAMVLCHEIAHAIDYYLKEPGYGNHGSTWQRIYRVLRKEYLSSTLNYQVKSFTFPLPEKIKQIPHQVKSFVQEGLFTTPQTQLQLI